MEDLKIQGTNTSPCITFLSDGHFEMEGRILTDNAVITFEPLFDWISSFKGSEITFNIHLDYINTSASMQLFSLLRKLDENCEIKNVKVIWHYEEDDEDHLETGEFYQDKLFRTEFTFVQEAA